MKKYIVCLVFLGIIEISLSLGLTYWRENFWQAVSIKDATQFFYQLGVFTVAAIAICIVSGLSGYLVSISAIKWREKLNTKAFAVRESRIENVSQRIQDDCMSYPDLLLNLIFGFGKSIMYILVFSTSLLLSFSWVYLSLLVAYSIIGLVATKYIASPLIALNYEQQRCEATYRTNLSISNFKDCICVMLGIAKRQKRLTYFQQLYSQIGVVLPLIMIAPVYFGTGMTIGLLMRFNSVGSTLLDNTSFGITSFAVINKWLACRKRLKEINVL